MDENNTSIAADIDQKIDNLQNNSENEGNNSETDQEKINEGEENSQEKESESDELPLPEEPEEDNKKKLPKWVEKKLARKEREIQERARETELYKAEVERINSLGFQTPQFHQDPQAPKRADFKSDEEFYDARFNYNQQVTKVIAEEESKRRAFVEAENNFQKSVLDVLDNGEDRYDDFKEKVKDRLFVNSFPANRAMGEAIMDSPHKIDIFYFLGSYPEEARKIALLNPIQAVKRIAEIEARFVAKNKVTKAPNIIDPVRSNRSQSNSVTTLNDLDRVAKNGSQQDFEEAFKKMKTRNKW